MTDQPDLFEPDRPPRDLFAKDTSGRCMPCRAGSHRACRGRRQCTCPALAHSAFEANQLTDTNDQGT